VVGLAGTGTGGRRQSGGDARGTMRHEACMADG
jgi:hypothetical protein